MTKFYLLLHENPAAYANVSPAEMQAIVGRYVAWRKENAARGSVLGGHKLDDNNGRYLQKGRVHDGPFTEGKEIIGGLFIIQAEDWAGAEAIARTCPHCEFGAVEVRAADIPPAA
jgi:hypothetical protein